MIAIYMIQSIIVLIVKLWSVTLPMLIARASTIFYLIFSWHAHNKREYCQ